MAAVSKTCEADENEQCDNVARGLCYHCSRNLCLDHLTEHVQLLDALNRSKLDGYYKMLTNLSLNFQKLQITSNILTEPLLKVEEWRIDAYRRIDEIVGKAIENIKIHINEYQQIFDKKRNQQLERINRFKQKISDLFRKTQINNKDMSNLEKKIEQIQNNLNLFDKHSIEVTVNRPLNPSLNIRMKLDDYTLSTPNNISSSSSSSSSSLSSSSIIHQFEFRLKYIRLSGIITCHYVLVHVDGTIGDLIDQFIALENNETKLNRNNFLATEICQCRVRQRFTNDIRLRTIFNQINEVVLYETPFELNTNNLQRYCLILCRFQDGLPWDIKFGLPFLIKMPRTYCKGQDLIDAFNSTIKTNFPFIIHNNDDINYEVRIITDDLQVNTTTILNKWADEFIDEHLLIADNSTLIVNLNYTSRTIDSSPLDGLLKEKHEKRTKNRK